MQTRPPYPLLEVRVTIAERKAREAYDRLNPWRNMCDAKSDGTVCELMFPDMVGHFDGEQYRYFLDPAGDWYRIDPPMKMMQRPMNWRPAVVKITPERRHLTKRKAAEVRI